eukprot:COSAG03_NODE_24820_length_269_cov_1.405882_1_plen_38_part_10
MRSGRWAGGLRNSPTRMRSAAYDASTYMWNVVETEMRR